jgi:predicted ribosomally synthesized peptide with nif11-like leader
MSQVDAAALIARLKHDEVFRGEVMAAPEGEERWKVISAAGFDCSPEELAAERERLTDQQLGEVNGGSSGPDAVDFGCTVRGMCLSNGT